jgi:hypothetical protein
MQETTEQYVARISGYVAGKNHLKVLGQTAGTIVRLISKATNRQLLSRPSSEKWSPAEILVHLAESEIVFGYRLRIVLGSNGATVQAFDQNAWQENTGYLKKSPREAFELFRVLRKNNIKLLKSLKKEHWDCYGVHQERGRESISRMVELYAGHDVNHLRQMAALLRLSKS